MRMINASDGKSERFTCVNECVRGEWPKGQRNVGVVRKELSYEDRRPHRQRTEFCCRLSAV